MGTTSAGVAYWDPTQAASVSQGTVALANSINTKVVAVFPSATERTIAYQGYTSAQKAGVLCWLNDRANYSYWDPNDNAGAGGWQWLSVPQPLFFGVQSTGVDWSSGAGEVLLQTGILTLPPGNRLVQVEARGIAQTLGAIPSNANRGLGFIAGGLVPTGALANNYMTCYLPAMAANPLGSFQGNWKVVHAGTFSVVLYGRGDINTRFNDANLTVTDLGATDL